MDIPDARMGTTFEEGVCIAKEARVARVMVSPKEHRKGTLSRNPANTSPNPFASLRGQNNRELPSYLIVMKDKSLEVNVMLRALYRRKPCRIVLRGIFKQTDVVSFDKLSAGNPGKRTIGERAIYCSAANRWSSPRFVPGLIITQSTIVIDAADVQGCQTHLQKDKRVGAVVISPHHPQNIAEKE